MAVPSTSSPLLAGVTSQPGCSGAGGGMMRLSGRRRREWGPPGGWPTRDSAKT